MMRLGNRRSQTAESEEIRRNLRVWCDISITICFRYGGSLVHAIRHALNQQTLYHLEKLDSNTQHNRFKLTEMRQMET